MKVGIIILVAGLFLFGTNLCAEDGEAIFDSLRCNACHKPDTGKAMPSLKIIAAAYEGKEDRLLSYFKGDSEPVVNPEKKGIMRLYIEKTKDLEDDQRKALADFILSH